MLAFLIAYVLVCGSYLLKCFPQKETPVREGLLGGKLNNSLEDETPKVFEQEYESSKRRSSSQKRNRDVEAEGNLNNSTSTNS